jgi:hypothetical protein
VKTSAALASEEDGAVDLGSAVRPWPGQDFVEEEGGGGAIGVDLAVDAAVGSETAVLPELRIARICGGTSPSIVAEE